MPGAVPTQTAATPPAAEQMVAEQMADVRCDSCAPVPMRPEVARAVDVGIADLKEHGGSCPEYDALVFARSTMS